MGFSFSATAQCDLCGEYLSSSEEDCEHNGAEPIQSMFRRIGTSEAVTVRACPGWHWYKLKDVVGEDWIAYEWLGPKPSVQNMVGTVSFEELSDVPSQEISTNAPEGVEEYGD